MDEVRKIGARIKERRNALGLSVDEIAEYIGKNRATVYRYESDGIANLPANVLGPLAKALNTTAGYLMGWTSDPYDYDRDEEGRIDSIPLAYMEGFRDLNLGPEEMWRRYCLIEESSRRENEKLTTLYGSELSEKDVRLAKWFNALPVETRRAILTLGGGPADLAE